MSWRFAFVGFRHPHILDMYRRCQTHPQIEVVGCCEEDSATRTALAKDGEVAITHTHFSQLLANTDCDVIAVGDCYGLRAARILEALGAGKQVISDKPFCISRSEFDRIASESDRQQRIVGCMLDMRDLPVFAAMRDAIQDGTVGDVHAVSFQGQHPLLLGQRPGWYFEPGMHGGVFNDIAIHAMDVLPWMTGLQVRSIVAARGWNATVPQFAHFQQCGQMMLTLENGAGVQGDVSYLTPDSFGYRFPGYWRFLVWGSDGVLDAGVNSDKLTLFRGGAQEPELLELPAGSAGAYLESFLAEISPTQSSDHPVEIHLTSNDVRQASQLALQLQAAADQGQVNVLV